MNNGSFLNIRDKDLHYFQHEPIKDIFRKSPVSKFFLKNDFMRNSNSLYIKKYPLLIHYVLITAGQV